MYADKLIRVKMKRYKQEDVIMYRKEISSVRIVLVTLIFVVSFISGFWVCDCQNPFASPYLMNYKPLSLPGMEKRKAIMKHGDIVAYPTYLFYSMVMANIYNYAPANYDVFEALNTLFSPRNKIDSMDVNTARIAFFFLKRGKDMGDLKACMEWRKQEILQRYGKGINANLELDL